MNLNSEQIKDNWKHQVNAARIAWARLSVEELLASEGRHDKLVGLVQERYGLSIAEASRRVRNFMENRTSFIPSSHPIALDKRHPFNGATL